MTRSNGTIRIAYVVGSADEPSEQFIGREVDGLTALGAHITIYSVTRDGALVCPFCALGRHLALPVQPAVWRALRRLPWAELARLRVRAWREFPGGLDLAAGCASDARAKGVERVHAHFATKPAAVGLMMAAMLRVPFSFSAHARDVFAEGCALDAKVRAADFVAVCNLAALEQLRSRIRPELHSRLALVRHGLDLAEFEFREPPAPHSPLRVLAAGRLVEKKGFSRLIEAMGLLSDCACDIAGSGPLAGALSAQIAAARLESRVRLLGWLPPSELRARMAESDVLVVPSVVARDGDRDGVPNVMVEAAALGLPLVASDAGGIAEFIEDGETGRLVPAGDTEALASAVGSVAADPAAARRLARNARKKVEIEYDLRENVARLKALFTRPG